MEKTMPNTTILSKMNRTDSFSCSHHSFLPDQRRCTVLAVMAQLCIPEGSTHTQDLKPQPLKLTHTLSLSLSLSPLLLALDQDPHKEGGFS